MRLDVGHTTRLAITAAIRLADWGAAAEEVRGSLGARAAGNGSLMRTLPVALAYYGDDDLVIRDAKAISNMTHPAEAAEWCCALYCLLACTTLTFRPGGPTGFVRCRCPSWPRRWLPLPRRK